MSEFQIVTHPLCPHGQRLVIIGLIGHKEPNVDYELTYLPYATLHESAPKYSPTGDLPVLLLDGELASWSTEGIAEYMNSVLGLGLLPEDPDAKLKIRTGERMVSASLDHLRGVFTTRDQVGLDAALDKFFGSVGLIEGRLESADDSDALTHLGFIALSTVGSLVNEFALLRDNPQWEGLPKVKARIHAASENPIVIKAKCPNYSAEFERFFAMTGSAFPALAGPKATA